MHKVPHPNRVLHSFDAPGEPLENALHVSALLHGDDPQLVLLVDPDQISLILVVEDPATLRPVSLHTGGLEILVAGHEEEMIIHQLLSDSLVLNNR